MRTKQAPQAAVDSWNMRHQVGGFIWYDDGTHKHLTNTLGSAYIQHSTAVVKLKKYGVVKLAKCRSISGPPGGTTYEGRLVGHHGFDALCCVSHLEPGRPIDRPCFRIVELLDDESRPTLKSMKRRIQMFRGLPVKETADWAGAALTALSIQLQDDSLTSDQKYGANRAWEEIRSIQDQLEDLFEGKVRCESCQKMVDEETAAQDADSNDFCPTCLAALAPGAQSEVSSGVHDA